MTLIRRRKLSARGFSIIEAAFVTMIAGVSTVAMMQLLTAGTFANREATQATAAINLADNIHEATLTRTFDQVVAMNGATYSPPVDSRLTAVFGMSSAWSQSVAIAYVTPNSLSATSATPTDTARVTVNVSVGGRTIQSISWIVGR